MGTRPTVEITYEHTRYKSWGRRGKCPRDGIQIAIHENGEVDILRYDRPVKSDEMLAYEETLKQVREGKVDPSTWPKAPPRQIQPDNTRYASLREAVDHGLADFVGSVAPDRVDELKQKMIEMQEPPPRLKGIRALIARFRH